MKRIAFLLFIFINLMPMAEARAQEMAKAIDSLTVELWPDYDRPSVLVLMTGALPADTPLPASVSIPLPDKAQLNAVARIDGKDGVMKDDIFSTEAAGAVMFITPDTHFRLEYYLPYTLDDNQRSFTFTWSADLSVEKLMLRVQQPVSAGSMSLKPPAANVFKGEDGFVYHAFPARAVKAGESFSLQVDYRMVTDQLSAERLPPRQSDVQATESPPAPPAGGGMNWPLIAIVIGGLLIVLAVIRQLVSGRSSRKSAKLPDQGAEEPFPSEICKQCGRPAGEEDKFCGQCGQPL